MESNNTSESPSAPPRIIIRFAHDYIALYTTGITFVLQMLICILFLIRGLTGNAHSLILGIMILIWVAVFDAAFIKASVRK